jgi:polar amino acid transport system substrate-binding protein
MTRFGRRLAGAAFGLGVLWAGPGAEAARAADYALVTGSEYPPYADQKLPDGGLALRIVREAFGAVGKTITIDILPWSRGFAMTGSGKFDATFPYVPSALRSPTMAASDPLVVLESHIWSDPARRIEHLKDVGDKRYCSPVGYSMPDKVQALADSKAITVFSPPTLVNCAKMIASDHADFIVLDALVMKAVLNETATALYESDEVVQYRPLAMLAAKTNPKSQAVLSDFNAGLAKIKADGRYDRIIRDAER